MILSLVALITKNVHCSWSLMTHRVSVSEQGELQGALGSMRSIAMLIGPGLFSAMFAYSIDLKAHAWQVPGAAWYLAALLLAITVALAVNVGDATALQPAAGAD